MWTTLNGRDPNVETLGIQLTRDDAGKTVPVFGPIPAELYDQIPEAAQKDKKSKEEIVIVRFELTNAEFETTHGIYQLWDKYANTHTLPQSDRYANALEFLRRAAEGLIMVKKSSCNRPTQREVTNRLSIPPLRPWRYKDVEEKERRADVSDATFRGLAAVVTSSRTIERLIPATIVMTERIDPRSIRSVVFRRPESRIPASFRGYHDRGFVVGGGKSGAANFGMGSVTRAGTFAVLPVLRNSSSVVIPRSGSAIGSSPRAAVNSDQHPAVRKNGPRF